MDHDDLQAERGAQDQGRAGSRDRDEDVSGPDHQVQGRLDHVGDRTRPAADRQHEHVLGRRTGAAQQPGRAAAQGSQGQGPVPGSGRDGIGRRVHRQRRADPHPAQDHPAHRHEDRLADPEAALNTGGSVRTLVPLAIAALLTACAVKPPPPPEEVRRQAMPNVAVDRPSWAAANGVSAGAVQPDWPHTFHAPQPDALVNEAIANNPDLRVAAARVEQAAQSLVIAQSALKPSLGIFGTGGGKTGGGGGDPSSALQAILLSASWELDLWGRIRYARNAAQEDLASAQADLKFARQSLAASVAKAWFTA